MKRRLQLLQRGGVSLISMARRDGVNASKPYTPHATNGYEGGAPMPGHRKGPHPSSSTKRKLRITEHRMHKSVF